MIWQKMKIRIFFDLDHVVLLLLQGNIKILSASSETSHFTRIAVTRSEHDETTSRRS